MSKKAASAQIRFEPALHDVQAVGFPMGGEGLAVDLADTIVTVTHPPTDLLADRAASDAFWSVHAPQLPGSWKAPALGKTRALRDAIRALFDAVQQGGAIDEKPLGALNGFARLALPSPRATLCDGRIRLDEDWRFDDPADLPLAAAARSALEVLGGANSFVLRRCQSPACSMLFVTGDSRRRWCTPNICANRDRVARHYRRHRSAKSAEAGSDESDARARVEQPAP